MEKLQFTEKGITKKGLFENPENETGVFAKPTVPLPLAMAAVEPGENGRRQAPHGELLPVF